MTNPLTIAMYTYSWPEAPGMANGVYAYLKSVVPALRARGHVVKVICQYQHGEDDHPQDTVPVVASSTPISRRLFDKLHMRTNPARAKMDQDARQIARTFEAVHAETPLDIIEMEESFGYGLSFSHSFDVPWVLRLHGPCFAVATVNRIEKTPFYIGRYDRETKALAMANGLSAPSKVILDRTLREVVAATGHHEVIANPVPRSDPSTQWAIEKAQTDHVVVISRFERVKGGDIAIRALAKAMDIRPSLTASIAGEDKPFLDEDGIERMQEEYILHHCPEHRERFQLLGKISPTQVTALRQKGQLCLVPSRFENFPYAVVEAMFQGAPLVATNVGGIPEVTGDQTAYLVPSEDIAAMAEAILHALDHSEETRARAERGQVFAQQFTTDAVIPKMEAFYRKVMSAQQSPTVRLEASQ